MSLILPIDLEALLRGRSVESERVEFEASWNRDPVGPQVLRTICAFANDYHNLNGGYLVIGVEERDGRAVLPPVGCSAADVEAAQKWIRGQCNRLDPPYPPILSPETVAGRLILVVWAPASEMRPHRAPADRGRGRYWVRIGAETVDAETRGGLLPGLIRQTARVPWDDRRASAARVEDLREVRVREYLRDVRSGLIAEPDARNLYRRLRITSRVNDHEAPRNVGLLFFSGEPTEWFRGARIEVVQFAADRAGEVQEERVFGGGLADQVRDCLHHLENLSASHLRKQRDRSRVRGFVGYPLPALRETLVNAMYHRGYDLDQPEPTKVCLYPGRIEVVSYPGPVPGIERHHLAANAEVPAAPARNRRIGEFLKELGLAEGRLSGLPRVFRAMEENGSPAPRFDFDEQRTYFRAILPAHPEYGALSALRDAAHLRALGEDEEALRRLETAWESSPGSAILARELIRSCGDRGRIGRAEEVFGTFEARGAASAVSHLANTLAEVLLEAGDERRAKDLLERRRPGVAGRDATDAAILARRLGDFRAAHRSFERAGDALFRDARGLHEFARTKMRLAGDAHRRRQRDSNRRLLTEARGLLERVVQLDAPPARHGWAWRDLARALDWLGAPVREVEAAYRRAIGFLPGETRFVRELERLGSTGSRSTIPARRG